MTHTMRAIQKVMSKDAMMVVMVTHMDMATMIHAVTMIIMRPCIKKGINPDMMTAIAMATQTSRMRMRTKMSINHDGN